MNVSKPAVLTALTGLAAAVVVVVVLLIASPGPELDSTPIRVSTEATDVAGSGSVVAPAVAPVPAAPSNPARVAPSAPSPIDRDPVVGDDDDDDGEPTRGVAGDRDAVPTGPAPDNGPVAGPNTDDAGDEDDDQGDDDDNDD